MSRPPVVIAQDAETRRALRRARNDPDDRPADLALLIAAVILLALCGRLLLGV